MKTGTFLIWAALLFCLPVTSPLGCYKVPRRQVLTTNNATPDIQTEHLQDTIYLRELSTLVEEAVATLPEQRRKIYLLSPEGGMTIPQIAELLGISPNTVKNTLVTSLKSIGEYLEKRGYLLPAVLWLYLLSYSI